MKSTQKPGEMPQKLCGGLVSALSLAALLLAFSVLFAAAAAPAAYAVQNFNIKIGVAENVSSGKLLGSGLVLRDAKGTSVKAPAGTAVAAAGSGVKAGGKTLVLPVTVTAKSGLGWDRTKYRGNLKLVRAGAKFTVVNEVDLENYLRGILKIEMNPEWHIEALKAQAIIARTYAVRNRGRFAAKGFDLCATANSQIYRGINGEDPRTDRAIAETKGEILAYGGKAANVFYHSDSGGATADVSHVWGGSIPYLKAKREKVEYESPYSSWHVLIPPADAAKILARMGHNVGAVKNIEVVQSDSAGRAVTLGIAGDRGRVSVKAHAFRMAAGSDVIRSTNFSIGAPKDAGNSNAAKTPKEPDAPDAPNEPVAGTKVIESLDDFPSNSDPLIEMTKLDVFTKDEIFDMILNPDKREAYLDVGLKRLIDKKTVVSRAAPSPPKKAPQSLPQGRDVVPASGSYPSGQFLFVGCGWGHGVGMSQWGAKAMADSGIKCADILSHYFQGTKITK